MTKAVAKLVSALLVGVLLAAGCASSGRHRGPNSRLIITPEHGVVPAVGKAPGDSLETVIGKIRELSSRARPVPKHVSGVTIEGMDQQLGAALLALRTVPSGAAHRRVAGEYIRVGVPDAAFGHYRAAIRLNPRDGAAYDGLARIWRDWRLPGFALGDARRAVYFAAHSPEAHNTLGTVLQALGRSADAKAAYRRSLELNPAASYALNNLGYILLMEGDTEAFGYFRRAIANGGDVRVPRHNLALAYAASGRLKLAERELRLADPPAAADYNTGIIHLSRRDDASALAAFESACRIDPTQPLACARATAVRRQLLAAGGTQ